MVDYETLIKIRLNSIYGRMAIDTDSIYYITPQEKKSMFTDSILNHMIVSTFEKNIRKLTKVNSYVFLDETRETVIIDLWYNRKYVRRYEVTDIYNKIWTQGKTIPYLAERVIDRYKEQIFDELFTENA